MPRSSEDIGRTDYLRMLVLGAPKSGKTTCCITTAPEGGVYVINSDDAHSLRPARARAFSWDLALGTDLNGIEKCIKEAREGAKDGRYQTVIWDTISEYSRRVEDVFANATMSNKGEPDGRRYWPAYKKHLHNILDRLFTISAHVIVTSHYIQEGAAIDGQLEKTGAGIMPLLGGKARATIPSVFQDVVFLELRKGKRMFTTAPEGVFGPGCRNLPGVSEVEADVSKFWEMVTDAG